MAASGCRELTVEYLAEPLGIGSRRPRFSWLAGHDQRAYEVVVECPAGGIVWESGRVTSPETSLVAYAGEPLRSNTRYTWRVRSWSEAVEPGKWASSTFETALLDAEDWTVSWIEPAQRPTAIERWTLFDWIRGAEAEGAPSERLRPVQLIRQRFTVTNPVIRARLYATAHGVYEAQLNGVAAGDQVLAPGFDSYLHRLSVQCYDVTALLRDGENVLAFALADGWWAGRIGITGSSAQFGATTGATWQLHLDHADGSSSVVSSGADVVSSVGPWAYADLFVGERYDRRLLAAGWAEPGFDDSAWTPVAVSDAPTGILVPFTGEPVRRVQELAPVSIRSTDGGWLVDFGQVIAGRIRLTVRGAPAGHEITVEHTETLAADGSWFQNILGINKEQADVYVAGGLPVESWEPSFTFHGFRYARVCGLAELAAGDVTAVVLASDLEQTGSFTSSDARLNRLHQNVVWSQRANFLSIPTDCPQRERAGWTGDIQVFAPAATNNAMVAPFLGRWLAEPPRRPVARWAHPDLLTVVAVRF